MSDLLTLIDMGFSEEKAYVFKVYKCVQLYFNFCVISFDILLVPPYSKKALQFTNNKGVEPAMEWLLAHCDDAEVAPEPSVSTNSPAAETAQSTSSTVDPEAGEGNSNQPSDSTTGNDEAPEAKSLKCDEWFVQLFFLLVLFLFIKRLNIKLKITVWLSSDRLFKNEMEVEFHAAKSGHCSFSESTLEKKPLSEEEKKAQLALLEEKLRTKRLEREAQEKRDALEREKIRIRSGKDISEAQRKTEEQEMKKLVEQRRREKQEDRIARDRVKQQIEADKAARREQMAL